MLKAACFWFGAVALVAAHPAKKGHKTQNTSNSFHARKTSASPAVQKIIDQYTGPGSNSNYGPKTGGQAGSQFMPKGGQDAGFGSYMPPDEQKAMQNHPSGGVSESNASASNYAGDYLKKYASKYMQGGGKPQGPPSQPQSQGQGQPNVTSSAKSSNDYASKYAGDYLKKYAGGSVSKYMQGGGKPQGQPPAGQAGVAKPLQAAAAPVPLQLASESGEASVMMALLLVVATATLVLAAWVVPSLLRGEQDDVTTGYFLQV